MWSIEGNVAVLISNILGNTSDAINDHISELDKALVRNVSLPYKLDSSIGSSFQHMCVKT